MPSPASLADAIRTDDAAAVSRLLEADPDLKRRIDEPLPGGSFGQTALLAAVERANREVMDVLLRSGADINQKSHWWAGPFHVLDEAWRIPWLPSYLLGRGAVLEIHHAVRLGMMDEVRRMLAEYPAGIDARGGDGQRPLHLAQTVEMAAYLLDRGADMDARDVDHESTAAQWMVRDRPTIARALVRRGCSTDILMASALGEVDIVSQLLDAAPDAIRTAVNPACFPMRDPRAGGSIYIWTLGANRSAQSLAREFGQEEVWRLLMARTPEPMKLALACEDGDDQAIAELLAAAPGLASTLTGAEQRKVADAAQDNRTETVRRMLGAGWPAEARGQHRATALHWAAFHGNADMAGVLVAHGAPVNLAGNDFDGTPLDWALYGSEHGWHRLTGDYPGTIALLRVAGGTSR